MQSFVSGDAALDLASLNGEDFEKLVEALFHAMEVPIGGQVPKTELPNPVISVQPSGRGPDQGRDLLITTIVNDGIVSRQFKWVVQCKHFAKAGKSVQLSDFRNDASFRDTVDHHQANGYLLVCSTVPATNLQSRFERLTAQSNNRYLFIIWSGTRVREELSRHPEVMKVFFPEHYRRYYQKPIEIQDVVNWATDKGATEEELANIRLALTRVVVSDDREEPQ